MEKDFPGNVAGGCPTPAARRLGFRIAAAALATLCLTGLTFLMLGWFSPLDSGEPAAAAPPAVKPVRLFQDWPAERKPEIVLLLSASQHGYLKACGCSEPQYGGLPRRYNFLQGLVKERGWPVVAVDLGDVAQSTGPQALLKYKYSMEALKRLSYTAVGIGSNEMSMPLLDGLANFALQEPSPRILAANLKDKNVNFPNATNGSMVGSWEIAGTGLKVGVVGVVGPSVAKEVRDPMVKFEPAEEVLPGVLKAMQNKAELLVLLYQGTTKEAKDCAAKFPQLQVVLALSPEEEPPEKPERVGNTLVASVGHKGRNVGLVGVYRSGKANKPFDLYYQLARLGPEYNAPQGNPISLLLEEYAKEVKKGNYLAHFSKGKHPIQTEPNFANAEYVGSDKCKKCHEEAYKIWDGSDHAKAYVNLVEKAKDPSLRQYDGECVKCHVIGFEFNSGFKNEKDTPHLKNVGCESCHGPGSLHVKNKNNVKLRQLMNPYKTPPNETQEAKKKRMDLLDLFCQKCHDIDNDVHWDIKKWEKIVHMEPKDK